MPNESIDLARLCDPFHPDDIEWRVQKSGFSKSGQPYAIVVAYIDNRAIQERLDSVCGPGNWQNQFSISTGGALCGIGIHLDGGWVWKWDGAENTEIEAFKGGLSGAMKRAAVHWGIGRYLYKIPASFAEFSERGKYKDEIKEKNGPRREWKQWNPPPLPAWALPKVAAPAAEGKPEDGNGKGKDAPPPQESKEAKPLGQQIKDIIECGLFNQADKKLGLENLNRIDAADVESLLNFRNIWQGKKDEAAKKRNIVRPAAPTKQQELA